ncbi:MAG: hypothetical protein KDA41_02570, partial [Planctomycetales bacterium]|nr:hypothetical protein [Planctomycetales bacterium]
MTHARQWCGRRPLWMIVLGLCVGSAAGATPRTFDETVRDAGAVFVGTLQKATSHWGDPSRSWLETELEFVVDDAIVADAHVQTSKKITLTCWGGQIGNRRQASTGQPEWKTGTRYLLMLDSDYAKAGCRQPLVGRNQGFFVIGKQDGEETVLDYAGRPVVHLGEDRLARTSEIGARKMLPEAVSLDELSRSMRRELPRIQSMPKAQPATYAPARARRTLARRLSKGGTTPQSVGGRTVAPAARSTLQTARPKVVRSSVESFCNTAKAVAGRAHDAARPKWVTERSARLPLVFNQLPADIEFASYDTDCMSMWNFFFPNTFKVYQTPLDTVDLNNGVSDIWGLISNDELRDATGEDFDDMTYLVFWWTDVNTGEIIEADILFNADYEWSLEDEAVYEGSDDRVSFRHAMMQALGWALGLELSNDLALMNEPIDFSWEGIAMPQADDVLGVASLYPRADTARSDLLLTLATAPQL